MTIPGSSEALHGAAIIEALKRTQVEFVLSMPDICTSEGPLRPIAHDPDLLDIWHLVRSPDDDIPPACGRSTRHKNAADL
jgi:hypothetical protein